MLPGAVGILSRLVEKCDSELGCSEHSVLELYGVSTTELLSKSDNTNCRRVFLELKFTPPYTTRRWYSDGSFLST